MAVMRPATLLIALVMTELITGCRIVPRYGEHARRTGDEILVCGEPFHTGTRVVNWMEPGGYDAYRVERKFVPTDKADWKSSQADNSQLETPNRYGFRKSSQLSSNDLERVRSQGWDLDTLQKVVDQFVLHYDVSGTSRRCFETLHDRRGLSVHFLLDVDGTIYQTLDLKERAWHATTANTRAIGIEIAQIGAVALTQRKKLDLWYTQVEGTTRLTIPDFVGPTGVRTPNFIGHPARPDPVVGRIHGETLVQYDFTPEQYAALTKLTASLCRVFPKLRCDYPRDESGKLVLGKLSENQLTQYTGLLGHFHIQKEKHDPGPAFQWDKVVTDAQRDLRRRRWRRLRWKPRS
jgi:N-acetylmuramoyl-L-alanine amidase